MQRGDRVTDQLQLEAPIASTHTRTEAEQETVLRWNEDEEVITAWTASRKVAGAWLRAAWPLVVHSTIQGRPASWEAEAPARALTFRHLEKLDTKVRPAPTGEEKARLRAKRTIQLQRMREEKAARKKQP